MISMRADLRTTGDRAAGKTGAQHVAPGAARRERAANVRHQMHDVRINFLRQRFGDLDAGRAGRRAPNRCAQDRRA